MDLNSQRFSRWSSEPSEVSGAAVIVQVKVNDRLLSYPQGKSAMVWYGVLAPCTASRVEMLLEELADIMSGEQLVWRFLVSESAESDLQQLLWRFEKRFGSAPERMGRSLSARLL